MITNRDLKRCCPQVFTYSAQYQAPFYGREKSISEMQRKVEKLKSGEVLCISEPLGTGKTFLVNHLIAENKISVPRGASFLTVREIADNKDSINRFPGDVLVVDEADIKLTYSKLQVGLGNLEGFIKKYGKRAIVIGDFSLKDPEIGGILENKEFLLDFEPMDREFVEGVLVQRFHAFMGEFIDVDFSLDSVIDSELIGRYIAPEWMKNVNSFRGMFSLFQEVVNNDRYVRFNSDKAFLELSMFKEYLADDNSLGLDEEEQQEFLEVFRAMLKSEYADGSGISRGFTVDELYGLVEEADIDVEYEDFAEDILYPMAMSGLIVSVGVPRKGENGFVRRPEPYVPSIKLMLSLD